MKRNTLDRSVKAASYDNIKVVGINSILIDFKLAWNINNRLGIDLVRFDDIATNGTTFSFYFYSDRSGANTFNLVSLVNDKKVWLKTSPHIDYLLIVRNEIQEVHLKDLISEISKIREVGYAFLFDLKSNRDIHLVLETIEYHEAALLKRLSDQNKLKFVREQMRKNPD